MNGGINDYISRKLAEKIIAEVINRGGTEAETLTQIHYCPAADVVEVVRCGQCKHCVEHYDTDGNAPYWTCQEWDSGTDYDGYCYYGEQKYV